MKPARRFLAFLAAAVGVASVFPAAAQYRGDAYAFGYADSLFAEQLRRERQLSEWRAVSAILAEDRTAFRYPGPASDAPAGPTSWRAGNENPWANAYGTPSSSGQYAAVGTLPRSAVKMCSCYLPADARSWDGGPLTPADIARRCRAQCF
jgi:hypothetical protein